MNLFAELKRALSAEDYDRDAALDRLESRIRAEREPERSLPDPYLRTTYTLAFWAYDRVPQWKGEFAPWWWFPDYPGLAESKHRREAIIDAGLPDYWHEHGFPPQCRPVLTTSGEEDFECD